MRRAHFVGAETPQHDPAYYLQCISSLLHRYYHHSRPASTESVADDKKQLRPPPLIVNTHGWVKGLGEYLLTEVLQASTPTHVFQASELWAVSTSSVRSVMLSFYWAGELCTHSLTFLRAFRLLGPIELLLSHLWRPHTRMH